MTYQEIKDRLTKCELTLEKIKDGTYKPENVKQTTEKLNLLRESYVKLLKEAQEKTYLVTPKSGKTAALSLGDDEVDALKDADDIDKIKSSDGQEVKEMKPGDPEDLERKRMERLTPKDQETIAKIYALMQNANKMEENEAEDTGDLDVGHQDDEPNMLMKDIYDIATYAAKLHKMLQKYDQFDGEVDFPHWWQSKIVKAREYISAAQHYLEAEEKQPALDALALEEGVEEASYNKLKKEYDALVGKMKQLAQHYKTAEGETKAKIVAALKQHTARKKELEAQLDQSVGGMGAGQELDPNINEYRGVEDDIRAIIRDKAADSGFDEQEEAMEVMEFIGQEYDIDFEFGAGPSRQMQEAKGGKYVVRPCSAKNTPWAVWKTSADGENDKRIKGFKTKPEAKKFADEKNAAK